MDIQTYKLTTPCLATHVPTVVMLMPDYEIKEIAGNLQKMWNTKNDFLLLVSLIRSKHRLLYASY